MMISLILLLWATALAPAFMPSWRKVMVAVAVYLFVQLSWVAFCWKDIVSWDENDKLGFVALFVFPPLLMIAGLIARLGVIFIWRLLKAGFSKMYEV